VTLLKISQVAAPEKKLHYMTLIKAHDLAERAVNADDAAAQRDLLQFLAYGPAAISIRQKQIRQVLLDAWNIMLDREKK
jgi:hypothetical protein